MPPLLSVCVRTFNRADLLDYSLGCLQRLEEFGKPFEVVVSDNASTDHTREVVERRQKSMPYLKFCGHAQGVSVDQNFTSALRHASGETVCILADDDGIVPENLVQHAERMLREPDLQAIYTDWIAWDDENNRELHRYFNLPATAPREFGPAEPLKLLNFIFQYIVFPEVALYRREAILRCLAVPKRGSFFYPLIYNLSRRGRIVFDMLPFYREHRVLKKQYRREYWLNLDMQVDFDPGRNSLETIFLLALQDAGALQVPADQLLAVHSMIDNYLNSRLGLLIQRIVAQKNWLLALDLRRRAVLWNGPGNREQQGSDFANITVPAAYQTIYETYQALSHASGVCFRGFSSRQPHDFFRTVYPSVPIIEETALKAIGGGSAGDTAAGGDHQRPLVVWKRDPGLLRPGSEPIDSGYEMYLDRLLDNYRVGKVNVDLGEL